MGYQQIPTATAVVEDPKASNYYGSTPANTAENGDTVVKGELQPPAFRDPVFAVFFWAQVVTVFVMSGMYASGRLEVDWDESMFSTDGQRFLKASGVAEDADEGNELNWWPLLFGSASALVLAPMLTIAMLSFMAQNGVALIQASLYFSIGFNILLGLICAVSGAWWGTLITGMGAFITWIYARAIWERIPLAAANLKTGVASVQSQLGVAFLGMTSLPLFVIWWIVWIHFFICTLNTPFMKSQVISTKIVHSSGMVGDDDFVNTLEEEHTGLYNFVVFLMLISFYWTHQVIGNTVQTTVAGSVGTFWFVPEEAVGCCSPALATSLFRSLTYSFGSICMGSLLVAIIQALRAMAQQAEDQARRHQDGGSALLLCLVQCILGMLESIAEFFNKWAFIYVGLYGYPYLEAGKNVITLFRERGWTTIISDNLTSRVLGMISFAIGLGTGILAAIIAAISGGFVSNHGDAVGGMIIGSLFVAFFVGILVASIVMSVVNGAVDTVIVLFAEAPKEFQENHPILSEEMNRAWSSGYPEMFSPTVPTIVV